MPRTRASLGPLIGFALFSGGVAALLVWNATAREVARDALQLLFGIVSTPFVLETTLALVFLIGLLAWNHWRLHKDGDGWVYLMSRETNDPDLPAKITQRLQSVVLTEKPAPLDPGQLETGVVEGYLELGMAAQAREELGSAPDSPPPPLAHTLLSIRVLSANLETEAALTLLRNTSQTAPASRPALAATAVESARWLLSHLHREDLARRWLDSARDLDPASIAKIGPDDPLRRLP